MRQSTPVNGMTDDAYLVPDQARNHSAVDSDPL